MEDGAIVGILAGSGHEEVMHCNDSVRGLSPPGSAPLSRPPPAFPEVRGSSVHTSIRDCHPQLTNCDMTCIRPSLLNEYTIKI